MYVEDLILRLACEGKFLFEPEIITSAGWEKNFTFSVASQINRGNALTEKQATLILRVLKKYHQPLEAYFKQPIDLENPIYNNPFRKLSVEKTIEIRKIRDKDAIVVRFAYDAEIIKQIQEYINSSTWKNQWGTVIKHEVASWDIDEKAWLFTLKEENILWIDANLVSKGFTADLRFKEFADEIRDIVNRITEYAPMAVKENGHYTFKNSHPAIEPIDTSNVLKFLFDAKNKGITAWDESVDRDYQSEVKSVVTRSLLNSTNPLFVDSEKHGDETLKDLLKYGGPCLVIIPGGSEIQHTKIWHQRALEWGITNKEMTVMFRTPNQTGGDFNQYVKENGLNNDPSLFTKIVFVSTKIPKPLVKSGLKFNTVLNLGYYSQLHFSMSVLLQSTTNVVYYNNKQPHGVSVVNS